MRISRSNKKSVTKELRKKKKKEENEKKQKENTRQEQNKKLKIYKWKSKCIKKEAEVITEQKNDKRTV